MQDFQKFINLNLDELCKKTSLETNILNSLSGQDVITTFERDSIASLQYPTNYDKASRFYTILTTRPERTQLVCQILFANHQKDAATLLAQFPLPI